MSGLQDDTPLCRLETVRLPFTIGRGGAVIMFVWIVDHVANYNQQRRMVVKVQSRLVSCPNLGPKYALGSMARVPIASLSLNQL